MKLLRNDQSGVALVEFAFILPILLIMLLGMVEIARFAIINQKVDKTANSMADFVTQGSSVSACNLDNFSQAVGEIMRPFNFSGTVVFSSITNNDPAVPPCPAAGVTCISWQHSDLGSAASRIGATGGFPNIPGGYTVVPGQNLIAAEVMLDFAPMVDITGELIPALAPQTLYKIALYKPRQGVLISLNGC